MIDANNQLIEDPEIGFLMEPNASDDDQDIHNDIESEDDDPERWSEEWSEAVSEKADEMFNPYQH